MGPIQSNHSKNLNYLYHSLQVRRRDRIEVKCPLTTAIKQLLSPKINASSAPTLECSLHYTAGCSGLSSSNPWTWWTLPPVGFQGWTPLHNNNCRCMTGTVSPREPISWRYSASVSMSDSHLLTPTKARITRQRSSDTLVSDRKLDEKKEREGRYVECSNLAWSVEHL